MYVRSCAKVDDARRRILREAKIAASHSDFKILQDDPEFAKLKSSLQLKVTRMTEQIQPLVFPRQK